MAKKNPGHFTLENCGVKLKNEAPTESFVDLDIRNLGVVSKIDRKENNCIGPLLGQVTKVTDISKPNIVDGGESAGRVLLINLTDGVTSFSALEIEPSKNLQEGNLPPGSKILFLVSRQEKCINFISNTILLRPDNFEIVGGKVHSLYEPWLQSKLFSSKLGGQQSKLSLPKFEIFDAKKNYRLIPLKETRAEKIQATTDQPATSRFKLEEFQAPGEEPLCLNFDRSVNQPNFPNLPTIEGVARGGPRRRGGRGRSEDKEQSPTQTPDPTVEGQTSFSGPSGDRGGPGGSRARGRGGRGGARGGRGGARGGRGGARGGRGGARGSRGSSWRSRGS
eukprot:GHVP01053737.1.p1 GENE.GHVP01053737.1~~GHVP01053737.1.p1  ORF type:complete len:335 (+),score=75.78 GHVP01053737.1:54-1058(+)